MGSANLAKLIQDQVLQEEPALEILATLKLKCLITQEDVLDALISRDLIHSASSASQINVKRIKFSEKMEHANHAMTSSTQTPLAKNAFKNNALSLETFRCQVDSARLAKNTLAQMLIIENVFLTLAIAILNSFYRMELATPALKTSKLMRHKMDASSGVKSLKVASQF